MIAALSKKGNPEHRPDEALQKKRKQLAENFVQNITTVAGDHPGTPHCSQAQIKLIEGFAKNKYAYPRVFVLIAQVAYLSHLMCAGRNAHTLATPARGGQPLPPHPTLVTTSQLLSQALFDSIDVRRGLAHSLDLALELLLLRHKQVSDTDHGWELTDDGMVFLLRGIRTRTAMRKVSHLSDNDICCHVSADEIEEWELDGEDRAARLAGNRGDVIKKGKRGRKGGRHELAAAIERASIERIKGSEIHSLWSGLVN